MKEFYIEVFKDTEKVFEGTLEEMTEWFKSSPLSSLELSIKTREVAKKNEEKRIH